MNIHPTAVIDPKAEISGDVEIGPYVIIESDVRIGPRVKIWAGAYICSFTEIGEDSEIHMGAVIGHTPQDISFKKKKSGLLIGKRNIIREYATVHRGTQEGSSTVIGDDNFIMGFAHIGHNCRLGSRIVIANASLLGGYVEVEDKAFISGHSAVQQFARIGAVAMIAGKSRVTRDVPPYTVLKGDGKIQSLNLVGLRKAGFSQEVRRNIKKAYKVLYMSGLTMGEAILKIEAEDLGKEVKHMTDFLKKDSKKGISPHA